MNTVVQQPSDALVQAREVQGMADLCQRLWSANRLFRSRPVGQVYNVHSRKLVMEPA
jgi:hypothetical protein